MSSIFRIISVVTDKYFKIGLAVRSLETNLDNITKLGLLSDEEILIASKFYNEINDEHDLLLGGSDEEKMRLYQITKTIPRPSIFVDWKSNEKQLNKFKSWIHSLEK